MTSTRRNLLTVSGGALAGLFVTPVPYKLLDDASIWTQNWSWIPRPPRGEAKIRHTACTLCPVGCGVEARCIGSQPVALAGVAKHPVSGGALCAIGIGAHQLPYHQARATQAVGIESVAREVEKAKRIGGRIAVIDLRPGRAASAVYRKFAGTLEHGVYAAPAPRESATLRAVAKLAGEDPESLGIDWENTQTVVSAGAPLLDAPGRALCAWKDRRLRIVEIAAEETRTAALAEHWLREWDEAAILAESPSLVLSGGRLSDAGEQSIAALNVRLGCVGKPGGIVRRTASPIAPVPYVPLEQIEDASIHLALIDHGPLAAWPEDIMRKLAPGAVMISFSPYTGGPLTRANILVPAPAFLETTEDTVTPWDAAVASWGLAPALLQRPAGVLAMADAFGTLEPSLKGAHETELKTRVAAIYAARRGSLFHFADAKNAPVRDIASADKLWEQFQTGAVWVDDPPPKPVPLHCPAPAGGIAAVLPPRPAKRFGDATVVPPLTTRVPA